MRTAFLHGKRAAIALIGLVLFVIYAMRRDLYLEETNLPLGWESLETYLDENKMHSNATSTNSSIFSESFLNQEQRQELPQWMQNYFSWHRAMREAFPGNTILTHPRAPKILVWTGVNGMTDRLRGFTFPFYMANQTQRMLFFQWSFPDPMEEFLVPTGALDWSLPLSRRIWARLVFVTTPRLFPNLPPMDASRGSLHDEFWDQVQDPTTTGANMDAKILKLEQYVGPNDPTFIELLQQAGDTKPILVGTNSYGILWRTLFQPSPRLQRYIDQILNQLGLTTRPYNAVHVRSRYPNDNLTKAARIDDHNQHDDSYYSIESDTHGLDFRGATKQYAIDVALHALQCAHSRFYTTTITDNTTSSSTQKDPIYFFSDSNHLSHYLANVDSTYDKKDPVDQQVRSFLSRLQLTVLTRPDAKTLPSLHLGHGAYRPRRYFPAFADLYIAMGAKCIAWGTGGYGRFPMELSNTQCQVQHRTSGGPTPCP